MTHYMKEGLCVVRYACTACAHAYAHAQQHDMHMRMH